MSLKKSRGISQRQFVFFGIIEDSLKGQKGESNEIHTYW